MSLKAGVRNSIRKFFDLNSRVKNILIITTHQTTKTTEFFFSKSILRSTKNHFEKFIQSKTSNFRLNLRKASNFLD